MKKIKTAMGLFILAAGLFPAASILKMEKPANGEILAARSTYPVSWTATGVTQNIRLILFRNNARIGIIADKLKANSSPYMWTVGDYAGGSADTGAGYRIHIRTLDNTLNNYSDGTFSIKGQAASPSLKVTFPAGGETFKWGSKQPFGWSASGVSGSVKVTLLRNGSPMHVICPSCSVAAGTWCWDVGDAPGWSCATRCGGGYKVRVEALDGSATADSAGTFTIVAAPPSGSGEPDFELSALDLIPDFKDDMILGRTLTIFVRFRWQNNGADYQGPLKVHYMYLDALAGSKISKDAMLEMPSVAIRNKEGRVDTLCTTERVPDGVESITFAVMLDPDNQVPETNEKNNYITQSIDMPNTPDLAIEDVHVSTADFYNDEPVEITFTVRNKGILPANNFGVRVSRGDGKDFGITIQEGTVGGLGGCKSKTAPLPYCPFRIPFYLAEEAPHTAFFVISADPDNRVKEWNEGNNTRWIKYTLRPTADPGIDNLRAKQQGENLSIDFSVFNKGYADSNDLTAIISMTDNERHNRLYATRKLGKASKNSRFNYFNSYKITWPKGHYYVDVSLDENSIGHDRDRRNNRQVVEYSQE